MLRQLRAGPVLIHRAQSVCLPLTALRRCFPILVTFRCVSHRPNQTAAASLRSPLEGVRVLDMTRVLAGPYCTMLLGDLGAEIIKIERPGVGDDTRAWRPPELNGESCYFLSVNRNKKSVTIDLKTESGQSLIQKLAEKSDILVENYLPGALDKYNLGYLALSDLNPQLIYTSITGYGQTGPWKDKGGYDVIAAAVGGLMHITGEKDGPPCKTGVALTDIMTGLYAHGAILAALRHRDLTGLGQHIDCNLLATQISALVNIGSNYLNAERPTQRWGTAHESIVPYQALRTGDGQYLVVGAGNDSLFVELCTRIGRIDLSIDDRFLTNAKRVQHREILIKILQEIFETRPLSEWLSILEGSKMPFGPVNDLKSAFSSDQVQSLGLVQTMPHRTAGTVKFTGPAVRYSNLDNSARSAPPSLGEHTDSVLNETLGLSDKEIESLKRNNVI